MAFRQQPIEEFDPCPQCGRENAYIGEERQECGLCREGR